MADQNAFALEFEELSLNLAHGDREGIGYPFRVTFFVVRDEQKDFFGRFISYQTR